MTPQSVHTLLGLGSGTIVPAIGRPASRHVIGIGAVERAAMTQSPGLRNFLLVVTVLAALLLMASAFPLTMSPMLFDSGENAAAWSVFIFVWLMPVLLIAGIGTAWWGYVKDRRRAVVFGLLIAAAPVVIAAGILAVSGAL